MSYANNERQEYRCCIAAENSAGKLKIGARTADVCVINTSRTGFGIRVANEVAKKLRDESRLRLLYAGETWEVAIKSRYTEDDQFTCVGLTRLRDLTKIDESCSWGGILFTPSNSQSDPAFLACLVLAFLVAVICLPGIGDSLGTAPKVREVIKSVLD